MKQETINQILDPMSVKIGYGIHNVDERIKLHFGAKYGVTIFSKVGMGTTVKITIPAFRDKL
jgi:sensor histidine kinase YesM